MKHKKMYLVKREVLANTIEQAIRSKGRIYEVVELEKQPPKEKEIGFKPKIK